MVVLLATVPLSAAQSAPDGPVSALVNRAAPDDVTVRAVRLESSLTLDGRLEEVVYGSITPLTDFIQQEPSEGAPATEKTEAWMLFDDVNVYVAARCWDSEPEREVANELRRDNGNILGNENVTFVIDTLHDRRNGYLFQTNPLGALRDMTITDDQQNPAWNGIWYVKAATIRTRLDDGSGDPVQVPSLPVERTADLGHQPAAPGQVEERVLLSVAGPRGPRHRRRQPDGVCRHPGRHRDASCGPRTSSSSRTRWHRRRRIGPPPRPTTTACTPMPGST